MGSFGVHPRFLRDRQTYGKATKNTLWLILAETKGVSICLGVPLKVVCGWVERPDNK